VKGDEKTIYSAQTVISHLMTDWWWKSYYSLLL